MMLISTPALRATIATAACARRPVGELSTQHALANDTLLAVTAVRRRVRRSVRQKGRRAPAGQGAVSLRVPQ